MDHLQHKVVSASLGSTAAFQSEITGRILETVRCVHLCEMEELVQACSTYTWNQVFLEVDRMTRAGQLRLLPKRAGVYAVTLPAHDTGRVGFTQHS
ncbi:MAG TPA: hypothetical protein VFS39_12565 [Nitrospira sp.]|nr:hypothetical protein [Nitrospira sp.]